MKLVRICMHKNANFYFEIYLNVNANANVCNSDKRSASRSKHHSYCVHACVHLCPVILLSRMSDGKLWLSKQAASVTYVCL